ncbi:VWA domain-containing protein [Acidipila sp. 4G-K13]|uniref:VWA domain-containing protein n=2 Tax=Paracidobacterium acidisoli TaxID=2303751 RepID=A0A372INX8_9BACT|nr:VWA domain-containing protein [Paracidobacterium acidisoli]
MWTLAAMIAAAPGFAQQQGAGQDQSQEQPASSTFTLRVNSDLVLTNVVVRDKKTGEIVRGLTEKDFQIQENGKPQRIASFDFESVDQAAPLDEATINAKAPNGVFGAKNGTATQAELRNHRLIVLFWDITSMQPEDIERAQEAARNYINKQMQPADLVAVVSLDTSLSLDQDFTANKPLLLKAVNSYSGNEGSGFAAGATSTTNQVEDASSFTADEQEYNDINTDRELFAIEDISRSLANINEKKSLLYFSGGIQRDGIENQASLHAAINAAVRSNLSIYSVDTRGLQAISPLGDASTGSVRGTGAYSGAATQNNFDSNFNTQEVMATLSSDTGGKAFFDSNDFSPAFERIQRDTSAYYVIGFHSTDPRRDGRYRRLSIKVNRSDVKLEYRSGYYAPADFKHSTKDDRERELDEELASDLPATDVAVYMQALYFRVDAGRFFVPVSLVVPGSQIPFVKGGDRDKATLDVIGVVKDTAGHDIGDVRDTVKLAIDQAQQVRQKNIQYTTGFTLPSGKYHLKFVVRENETGRMGSFETDINVPDMKKLPLKMSSVVLASQRVQAGKKQDSPLVRDGMQLVPNLPHVFRQDQHMYLLYEIYDPSHPAAEKSDAGKGPEGNAKGNREKPGAEAATGAPVHVLTSIEFLDGSAKAFETPLVQATQINVPARDAVAFQFDLPLNDLKPGLYICQINVIDDAGGSFAFPRTAVLIRPALPAAAPGQPGQTPAVTPGTASAGAPGR